MTPTLAVLRETTSPGHPNGNHASPGHEDMATDTHRLFEKLDEKLDAMQANQATIAAEQARAQGTMEGVKLSVQTLSLTIGDVTGLKVEARGTNAELKALTERIGKLEASTTANEWRLWVERLAWGGGSVAIAEALRRAFS